MPFNPSAWSEIGLTRRGQGAVLVIVAAVVFAYLFGERSLNAAAAPAVVALLAGGLQVRYAADPTVERTPPTPGFPGESREVTLAVEGGTTVLDLVESVPEALGGDREYAFSTTTPGEHTYELRYDGRGVHELGPTTVTVKDVFGLVQRRYTRGGTDDVVVYPAVYAIADRTELASLLRESVTAERQEFDDLREYVPGDPMRDIHWKSSAKQPEELIVREFAGREPAGQIDVAATTAPSDVDQMAAATASIVLALLEQNVTVDVSVPGARLRVEPRQRDRTRLLEVLARTEAGKVGSEEWEGADVQISGNSGRVTVSIGERATNFEGWQRGRAESVPAAPARGVES